jgi:hypothetical protein
MGRKPANEIEVELGDWIGCMLEERKRVSDIVLKGDQLMTFLWGIGSTVERVARYEVAKRVLGRCHGGEPLYKELEKVAAEIDRGFERGLWDHERPDSVGAAVLRRSGKVAAEIRDLFREWCDNG